MKADTQSYRCEEISKKYKKRGSKCRKKADPDKHNGGAAVTHPVAHNTMEGRKYSVGVLLKGQTWEASDDPERGWIWRHIERDG